MATKVGVLALQGAFGLHIEAVERCGVEGVEIRQPSELDDVDALIIPGGESTTMSKLMVTFGLVEPISKRMADNMAVFGTCAGMIMLATELVDARADQVCLNAIDMSVKRNAYGRQLASFEAELEFNPNSGLVAGSELSQDNEPFIGVFIRAPGVENLGPDVEVLATIGAKPVLCRQGSVLVASFHPELTADDRIHRLFLRSLNS